ncbi:hypothetical protein CRT60_00290 [Azospirillum palustre]|uniref:Uncharacterized protein n=1 Tax=Azospirillum palustre TaxID=2044885 RepID=A0A2B8BKZ0_9PROT|nr:hypothetical protein [Azospirillum palustre]PGH59456.1 hypothetical protein CRT60_00290 [Azospirillum palustre]
MADKTVKIRCISDRKPWTDTKELAKGEVVEVSAEVAALLIDREFAQVVADDHNARLAQTGSVDDAAAALIVSKG